MVTGSSPVGPTKFIMSVDSIIQSRASTRAFTDQPVDRQILADILNTAKQAPSSSNIQPWKVYVLRGKVLQTLSHTVTQAFVASKNDPDLAQQYQEQFGHYPRQWTSPYIDRRRQTGKNLYQLLDIAKDDQDGMTQQHAKNYSFFGAPVGLIFTNDEVMEPGSLVDTGMFIQNIALAAHSRGLGTCVQGSWCRFHSIVLPHIGAGAGEVLVCGMSLGWPDYSAVVNQYRTSRVCLDDFVKWCD